MIRQAITCDICGAEKKQTNRWFVAWEHAGELRVSAWNSRARLRAGSKHLCGQACLHKLADEFMERTVARAIQAASLNGAEQVLAPAHPLLQPTDASLLDHGGYDDFESSARLITTPPAPAAAKIAPRPAPSLVPMPERMPASSPTPLPQELPHYASRNWRAEAWERERERMMQSSEHGAEEFPRRISQA